MPPNVRNVLPVDSDGNPLGHSGGDPLEVSEFNAVEFDTAFAAGSRGTPLAAVFRPFGGQAETATDGNWTPLCVNGDGSLYVEVTGTVSTSAASAGSNRPLIYYYGSSAAFLFPVFDDTEYQWAATAHGAGYVNLQNASGVEVGTAGDPLRVDPTGDTTQPVEVASALPAGTNNIGDVDVLSTVTPANRTTTGTISALNGTVELAVPGCSSAMLQVSGTFTAGISAQGSLDGGTTWYYLGHIDYEQGVGNIEGSLSAPGSALIACGGLTHIRAIAWSYGSGTVNVALSASAGTQAVFLAGSIPGGDYNIGNVDVATMPGWSHSHITSNTTTVVKSGAGVMHSIVINIAGASSNRATVYDNTAGSGTVIAVINTTASVTTLLYDVSFSTGLTIVTATGTAPDMTVSYR